MDRFYVPEVPVKQYRETRVSEDRYFTHIKVVSESSMRSVFAEDDFLHIECFRAKNPLQSPPLVFLHYLGIDKYTKSAMIRTLKNMLKGRASLIFVALPYHLERTPAGRNSSRLFQSLNDEELLRYFQRAVLDTQRSMDWYKSRFGDENFYIFGVSLGALVSVIAMALDSRIRKAVFVNAGGNYEKIIWSPMMRFSMYKDCSHKECYRLHQWHMENLDIAKSVDDLHKLTAERNCPAYDPLTFASWLKGKEILLFSSLFDFMIPSSAKGLLRERMGGPPEIRLPVGHITIFLCWWYMLRKSKEFLYAW